MVERLASEFPRYNDVSSYDGHQIKFYKLTQLGFRQIYARLGPGEPFRLEDPQKMTAFADYIVPVSLRLMGMTTYSPALEHAMNTYQMIPRDSTQEIEIRAHCLYATALLTDEINKRRPPDRQIIIRRLTLTSGPIFTQQIGCISDPDYYVLTLAAFTLELLISMTLSCGLWDAATSESHLKYSGRVKDVFVNGWPAVRNGEITSERLGRALRCPGYKRHE